MSKIASDYGLRFCIKRSFGAQAGEGFAFIAQTLGKDDRPIHRDLSRVEVTESQFWWFINYRMDLGVYRYATERLPRMIHVGYLPGHYPAKRLKSLRARQWRRAHPRRRLGQW